MYRDLGVWYRDSMLRGICRHVSKRVDPKIRPSAFDGTFTKYVQRDLSIVLGSIAVVLWSAWIQRHGAIYRRCLHASAS